MNTPPPFALPAADPRDPPAGRPRAELDARERFRSIAALGALGAAATAATLAFAASVAVFWDQLLTVAARPAGAGEEITVQGFRDLASLPGPSPVVLAALVPAVALLLLAGVLRRLGRGARPLSAASPEALDAAERTMAWSVRAIIAGAVLVFVVPALLQLGGVRPVSLTTGSMAPAFPAGSLVFAVSPPSSPQAVRIGEVVVIAGPDGSLVTHRVIGVVRDVKTEVSGYRTRGDAVAAFDPEPVAPASVVGVVVGGVPVVGALRAWMASPLGMAMGLVLAWSFAVLASLLGDDRRRAIAAQAVASSTSRPTS